MAAIILATLSGNIECVKLLAVAGADVDAAEKENGHTAAHK